MKSTKTAGIFIPSMNRSDFIIRQLKYYSRVQCPHTIYIGDSSNEEHRAKIENAITGLTNIRVAYKHLPSFNDREAIYHLLSIMEEPYSCLSGDDDYQIPNSITKCIEFLEKNPDYSSASGYAVSFRLKNNGAYGELDRLADYPRPHVNSSTAANRVVDYFSNYFVPLFSVNRTEWIVKSWDQSVKIKDKSFGSEIIPSALSIVNGKTATIDCLGFIRQIHDGHYGLPNTFDWITSDSWLESYRESVNRLANAVSVTDGILRNEAEKFAKQGLWIFIQKQLAREYPQYFPDNAKKHNQLKNIRSKFGRKLPLLKLAYRRLFMKSPRGLHFEVLQSASKYYKDFKPIIESFSKNQKS